MEVASLLIAILALVLSAAALGWNVASFILQGQRAKLVVTSMGVLSTNPPTPMEPVLQMTVSATGRQPVEVTGWCLAYPKNQYLHSALVGLQYGSFPSVFLGDTIPHVVQPGSSASFNIPRVAVEKAAEHLGLDPRQGQAQIFFAARRPLRDKRSIADYLATPPT